MGQHTNKMNNSMFCHIFINLFKYTKPTSVGVAIPRANLLQFVNFQDDSQYEGKN